MAVKKPGQVRVVVQIAYCTPQVFFSKEKLDKEALLGETRTLRSKECTSWKTVGLEEYYFLSRTTTDVYRTQHILFQASAWHRVVHS